MLKFLLALALALFPVTAMAEDTPIFVTYGTNNGSLPPEYAWDNEVTIYADGRLLVKHCKGYATEGSGCRTRKGKVTEADMEAIREAAIASDLAANPAKAAEYPMVGGGGAWGSVFIDGQEYVLIWDPSEADANRVGAVLRAIQSAIPTRLGRFMHPD